jgi:menaquinone-dependent protoporphyrinogen oxidase
VRVLVSVASRHGGSTGIADAIAKVLTANGLEVEVVPPGQVASLAEYDGVVIGSGIYLGKWLAPARELVEMHADRLRRMPVWLFGSGPIVLPMKGEGDIAEGERLRELIGARDNRLFAGVLKKDGLSVFERVSVRMVGSPWGDYRPWPEIEAWAASIAESLRQPVAVA